MSNATAVDIMSNRAISLNGSGKLIRTFVKDPNAVDVRIGLVVSATGNTTFQPTVSIYETFQFGLINSGRQTQINAGANVSNAAFTERSAMIGTRLGERAATWTEGNTYAKVADNHMKYELNGTSNMDGQHPVLYTSEINLGDIAYSTAGFWMIRMFKTNTDGSNFTVQYRQHNSFNTPAYWEANMHDVLSNLSNTTINDGSRWNMVVTSTDSTNWDALDTVLLCWPFYNSQLVIHAMGYRSLPA